MRTKSMVLKNPGAKCEWYAKNGAKSVFGAILVWEFLIGENHLFITQEKTKSRCPAPNGTSRRHNNRITLFAHTMSIWNDVKKVGMTS